MKEVILGITWGTTIGVSKGDTRSLDYGSYRNSTRFERAVRAVGVHSSGLGASENFV